MKIPETNANVGAYYGNEENGQWQPNGVMVDSGVGGGVVGSGDAGLVHAPIYTVPRDPGYMMAAGYYSVGAFPPQPVPPTDDFADYMWMENEEDFDKQVMQQLEEEALMEQCIEAMLEDEQRARRGQNGHPTTSNGASISLEEQVSRSTLNPLAAEFVPTFVRQGAPPAPHRAPPHTHTHEEKEKPVEVSAKEEVKTQSSESATEMATPDTTPSAEKLEESATSDTPEVSAAEVAPSKEPRPREPRKEPKAKPEVKKPAKVEPRKTKPQVVKSEPKLPAKKDVKKEVKSTKSELKLEEADTTDSPVTTTEASKVAVSPLEEVPSGPKPINYAAAAKANKPKKATTPPATDKQVPPPTVKSEKTVTSTKSADKVDKQAKTGEKLVAPSKDKVKTDKPAVKATDKPRKNSTK